MSWINENIKTSKSEYGRYSWLPLHHSIKSMSYDTKYLTFLVVDVRKANRVLIEKHLRIRALTRRPAEWFNQPPDGRPSKSLTPWKGDSKVVDRKFWLDIYNLNFASGVNIYIRFKSRLSAKLHMFSLLNSRLRHTVCHRRLLRRYSSPIAAFCSAAEKAVA